MLNVHKIIYNSRIYGPGERTVIWFKGCSLKCQGCINPELWSFDKENLYTSLELSQMIKSNSVTLLGGEPLDQEDILDFIKIVKSMNIGIILFTGYSIKNREKMKIACYCDTVISEPFDTNKINSSLYLRGSENQIINHYSSRYNFKDFEQKESIEIVINNEIEIRGREKDILKKLLNI